MRLVPKPGQAPNKIWTMNLPIVVATPSPTRPFSPILAKALLTACFFCGDFGNFSHTHEMAFPKDCEVLYGFGVFILFLTAI